MLLSFAHPKVLSLPKSRALDLFYPLLFLYFLTLHADRLSVMLGGYTFRLNNFLALTLLCALFFRFRSKLFSFDRKLVLGLSCLFLSLCLSFYFSPYRTRCLFFIAWFGFTVLCYFIVPYLLILHLNHRKVLKCYFISFLVVGAYACLQLIVSIIGFKDPFCGQFISQRIVRPNAMTYEPSYYALYMTPFVTMVNLHYLLGKDIDFMFLKKLKLKHLIFINLAYLVSTSTGAFFAYFIFFAVLFFTSLGRSIRKKVLKYALLFATGGVVLLLIFPHFAQRYFLKFFTAQFFGHGSFSERWSQIVNCWKIFLLHPFVGIGLGGVPSYLYDQFIDQNGAFSFYFGQQQYAMTSANPMRVFEPSNIFTEILASLGIFGFLSCATIVVHYFRQAKKALMSPKISEESKHWIFLFLVSIVVTLCVWQFSQSLLRTYLWVHLGIVFGFLQKTFNLGDENDDIRA